MEKHKVAVIPTRLAVAMLLAAALFLIEAGVAEIMLASEATCREGLTYQRLAPLPEDTCLPDWQSYMLRAVSRGVVGLLFPNAPALLATLTMAVIYILIGGACFSLGYCTSHNTSVNAALGRIDSRRPYKIAHRCRNQSPPQVLIDEV
jgi:hypothetical protein